MHEEEKSFSVYHCYNLTSNTLIKLTITFMTNTIQIFLVQAKVILKNKTKGNVIIVIYPIDYEFRLSSFNLA